MKLIKTLTCAVAAAALLAFCATSARAYPIIGMVTNYSTLTISLTLTSSTVRNTTTSARSTLSTEKLINRDFLKLLTNSDFAGFTFPASARLVVDWDPQLAGHILVIDRGTNIIYDATAGTDDGSNSLAIDFYFQKGAASYNKTLTGKGNLVLNGNNNASFTLTDVGSVLIDLVATGPSTDRFTNKNFLSGVQSWTDLQNFSPFGADGSYGPLRGVTISGKITANGKGALAPQFINFQYFPPPV